ncbi:MAG TPA: hypothetical protein VNY77_01185 [Candidatus Angelobacter sp.]|nr:hypothetical protein [Candidatus Angelobacter sp.]
MVSLILQPAVPLAVGPIGARVDGFRRSHFDAVATQRLMSWWPDLPVARFADVQLVTLALQSEQRAREFVARTLGKLADADRELRVYRIEHTNRYVLTPDGTRFAVFYTKLYNRLLRPLMAADQPQAPPELRQALRAIDQHVDDYINQARLGKAA